MTPPRFFVRDALAEDVEGLLADVRPEDRAEWIAAGCLSTREALLASIQGYAKVARLGAGDGPVLCIWGAVPAEEPGLATGWLIGTLSGQEQARALHRILREEFSEMTARWPRLQCWADNRNVSHHVWIRWLGFKAQSSAPFGPYGLPFTYYLREPAECALPS